MRIRNRKALFLHSTILRGRRLKDDNEGGGGSSNDGIEVGAGFAAATAQSAGDDNRTDEQKDNAQVPAGEESGDNADGQGEEQNDDGDGGDDQGEGDDAPKPKKERDTAKYIRELKRERREERAARAAAEARLVALENSILPADKRGDTSSATSEKPDANDATKYPLGVLDDGYIEDLIEFKANQKVREQLDGRAQTESEQAEQQREAERITTLRSKVDGLAVQGAEVYDDYEEVVLEAGMRGDYKLTEETFNAASETKHAVDILYALATDKAEAERVSKLSPYQQVKYVMDKDAELTAKATPRTKPKAETPPSENIPRGRNSSSPIRGDTDSLDDFRKLYYKTK